MVPWLMLLNVYGFYSSVHSISMLTLPPLIVVAFKLIAKTSPVPIKVGIFTGFPPKSQIIGVPCPLTTGVFVRMVRMVPTVVPRVGLVVYARTVAVAAASIESCLTAVGLDDTPPEFAVDRLT